MLGLFDYSGISVIKQPLGLLYDILNYIISMSSHRFKSAYMVGGSNKKKHLNSRHTKQVFLILKNTGLQLCVSLLES